MSWKIAKSALEVINALPHKDNQIIFYGGEPLLQMNMIRNFVEFQNENTKSINETGFSIITNGLLLNKDNLHYFQKHNFKIVISYEGQTNENKLKRGVSYKYLNKLFEEIEFHIPSIKKNISISITLHPGNIPYLAESYEYLLRYQFRDILLEGVIGRHRSEEKECIIKELDKQYDKIKYSLKKQEEDMKKLPASVIDRIKRNEAIKGCHLRSSNWRVIDTNGDLYSCIYLANEFIKTNENGPFPQETNGIRIGNIVDHSSFIDEVEYQRIIDNIFFPWLDERKERYVGDTKCKNCSEYEHCFICPLYARKEEKNGKNITKVEEIICGIRKNNSLLQRDFAY